MKYAPAKVTKAGIVVFENGSMLVKGWTIDMGGRPGTLADLRGEVLLAIRDYIVSDIDVRMQAIPDEEFDPERYSEALIESMEFLSTMTSPKKKPWWKFW